MDSGEIGAKKFQLLGILEQKPLAGGYCSARPAGRAEKC